LMQFSTNDRDFIVDPFPLWKVLGNALNEVFADPTIVKVVIMFFLLLMLDVYFECIIFFSKVAHGADQDINWLQRDFGIYVVNLFDTHQAALRLGVPAGRRGFAHILPTYVASAETDKRFQLVDWRLRPLSDGMLRYARTDSRYLPYIYECMRRQLLAVGNETGNLLSAVLDAGVAICKRRYEKPRESYLELVRKSRSTPNSRQLQALRDIFVWRDKTARAEDESTEFVLPRHMLLKMCSELPREMQGVLACCSPVPPLVRQNLQEIHLLLLKAREAPLTTTTELLKIWGDDIGGHHGLSKASGGGLVQITNPVEDPLITPLDMNKISYLSGGCLLEEEDTQTSSINDNPNIERLTIKDHPDINIFDEVKVKENSFAIHEESKLKKKSSDSLTPFVSPFQRLCLLQPFMKHLKEEEDADQGGKAKADSVHNERVASIRKHFDSLTAMTPAEYEGEQGKEIKKEEGEVEEEDEEDEEEMKPQVVHDHGEIRPIRGKKLPNKRKRKRNDLGKTQKNAKEAKLDKKNVADLKEEDLVESFEASDFKQFSKGGRKKAYDPWKGHGKHKRGGGAAKQKQRYKGGSGKSLSFH